jgi:cell wall-associated NlpC family hydrolase
MPLAERERVDPAPIAASLDAGSDASQLGLAVVQAARAQINKPYVWGAAGPDAFDCSGLVQWAWGRVGVRIPKFTVDQFNALQAVPADRLTPGTLIFLQHTYPADYAITHVGIFTERGTVIEAPEPGLSVREVPFTRYAGTHYFGAARPKLAGG